MLLGIKYWNFIITKKYNIVTLKKDITYASTLREYKDEIIPKEAVKKDTVGWLTFVRISSSLILSEDIKDFKFVKDWNAVKIENK